MILSSRHNSAPLQHLRSHVLHYVAESAISASFAIINVVHADPASWVDNNCVIHFFSQTLALVHGLLG